MSILHVLLDVGQTLQIAANNHILLAQKISSHKLPRHVATPAISSPQFVSVMVSLQMMLSILYPIPTYSLNGDHVLELLCTTQPHLIS